MRGISLPIQTVVGIAIAVIVLLSVVAFFMRSFVPPTSRMSDTDAWNQGCGTWRMRGCVLSDVDDITIAGYDYDGDGVDDTLAEACSRVFGFALGDSTTPGTALYGSDATPDEIAAGTYVAGDNPCWARCCGT